VLRHARGLSPLREDADTLYDSMKVPHDTRWDLPLPSLPETVAYLEGVEERILRLLEGGEVDPRTAYFIRLVTFHEDMHDEAFTYTRQTLAYAAPDFSSPSVPDPGSTNGVDAQGDAEIPGGTLLLGAVPGADPFVFDNEKWAHPVSVAPFAIARSAVTNREYLHFVEDGGYRRPELWSPAGGAWRESRRPEHPVYWRRADGAWWRRDFDRWAPLDGSLPVIHVSAFEAEAYCRWAGRRLPTEVEWEAAASNRYGSTDKPRFPWGDAPTAPDRANLDGARMGVVSATALADGDSPSGCRQLIGNVWEWTASAFAPYPGFIPDPYRDYSLPWFDGKHRVLRGGAWATRARLLRNTWRNFYPEGRRDVFAGFRTCRPA
jgi:iron(II)-dependent oxidoreductase